MVTLDRGMLSGGLMPPRSISGSNFLAPSRSLRSPLLFILLIALSTIAAGASPKVHFLYGGDISDYALNYGFERARSEVVSTMREMDNEIQASFSIEKVHSYEEEEQLESSIQKLLQRLSAEGFNALVCTDSELMNYVLQAQESMLKGGQFAFKIFGFMNPSAQQLASRPFNVAFFQPPFYLSMYLAGIASGSLTRPAISTIGLIVSDLNDVGSVQNMNAFFLGVHQTNPSAKVVVATVDWQNTSIATMAAAKSLLESGAKIVTAAQGNPMANLIFNDNSSLPSVGYGGDQRVWVGENVLSNFLLDARPSFSLMLDMVINPPSVLSSVYYPNVTAVRAGDFSVKVNYTDRLAMGSRIDDALAGKPIFCEDDVENVLGIPYPSSNPCLTSEEVFNSAIMIPARNPSMAIVAHWTTYNATNRIYWKYSNGFSIAMLIVAALSILIAGLLAIHIISHRSSQEYAKATWHVVLLVVLAGIPNFASVAAWLGFPTLGSCNVRWWLDSLALWLLLTPLLARSYKLYRWKENRCTPVTLQYKPLYTVRAKELWLYWMIPVALAELIILIFWSSVTTPRPKDVNKNYLEFGTVEAACVDKRSHGPFYAWVAFNALLAAANVVFLYFLKGIPLSYEATSAGGSALNLIVLAGLAGFSSSIVNRDPVTVALAVGCKLLVGITSIIFVAVPKWWSIQISGHIEDLGDIDVGKYNDESELTSVRSKSQSKASRSESTKRDSKHEPYDAKMDATDPTDF